MSGRMTFDFSELEGFEQELAFQFRKRFPKEYDKFLRVEAREIQKRLKKVPGRAFCKITGNYAKGVKVGKLYNYAGQRSIRTYAGSGAPHAHLLELGHKLTEHKRKRLSKGSTDAYAVKRRAARMTYSKPGMGGVTRSFGSFMAEREREKNVFASKLEQYLEKLIEREGLS